MTICRTCSNEKPSSEFYVSLIRKDGEVGQCKDCAKARVRARAQTNPGVQEYDRKRAKRPDRIERAREITKRWRAKNPAGYKANLAVSNALRSGKLDKLPCLFCGATDVHAHHRDYSKPLDVQWLCAKCHHRLHAAFPETEGANKRVSP